MSRRTARKHAFFLIFQFEFHNEFDCERQTELYLANNENIPEEHDKPVISSDDLKFINTEINGTYGNLTKIDSVISENLSGWEIDRINKIDLAILRLAVYEMVFEEKIPLNVSINEAVELAKAYGTDDSYQFVNGVLASVYQLMQKNDG